MYCIKKIKDDLFWVGGTDRRLTLFENAFPIPRGVSYNAYVLKDEKTVLFDTVDNAIGDQLFENLEAVLEGRTLDYVIVNHMEPDHASTLSEVVRRYPEVKIVCNAKTVAIIKQFFDFDIDSRAVIVKENDTFCTGKHTYTFVMAPMVHWPEVMVTYDMTDKILFSADAFGTFGAMNGNIFADEVNFERDWLDDARRYYTNIVGKFGASVQTLLKKAAGLDIQMICPLHGPILKENLGHYIEKYDIWSSYAVEKEGVMIAYTSVYGNTKKAAETLAAKLEEKGCPDVYVCDLARDDMAEAVEEAFRYGKLVLATITYNADIFPFMKIFIEHLTARNYQKRTIGFIENGSWAPTAARVMKGMFEDSQDITWMKNSVKIMSSLSEENLEELDQMADELCQEYIAQSDDKANKNDLTALFRLGYGLYVVTSRDGEKDNGLIVNTVTQLTDNPNRVAVNINKANYSHDIIKKTGVMNVNCLSVEAPFKVFERFGFQSGREADKFEGWNMLRADNGVAFLPKYINAFLALKVEQYVDLDTHGMFICTVTEARVMNDKETMTYTYYQKHVKPKPQTEGKKGFVCVVCGYIYEGEELPDDYICPLCKHGVADFEPI